MLFATCTAAALLSVCITGCPMLSPTSPGPKIDITVYDALRRKFQCATVQLDFQVGSWAAGQLDALCWLCTPCSSTYACVPVKQASPLLQPNSPSCSLPVPSCPSASTWSTRQTTAASTGPSLCTGAPPQCCCCWCMSPAGVLLLHPLPPCCSCCSRAWLLPYLGWWAGLLACHWVCEDKLHCS